MKNIRYIQFLAIFALFFTFTTSVSAADEASVRTTASVAVEEDVPVILPTNPFYFAKEIVRDVRRFFTFGKINKASYELEVADQKALEVREIEKLDPKNTDAIKMALDNYSEDVLRLKTSIESIQVDATDARVDELLDALTGQAVRHTKLFDGLKSNDAIKDAVIETESAVRNTITTATTTLEASPQIEITTSETTSSGVIRTETSVQSATSSVVAPTVNVETVGNGTLTWEVVPLEDLPGASR